MLIAGLPFLSVEVPVEIFERIYGLRKAIKRVAEECIPSVPMNASMVKPVRNPKIKRNHPLISNGKSIINRI